MKLLIVSLALLLSLMLRQAAAQSGPVTPAIYRIEASAFGGTTMGALALWREEAAVSRRDTLTPAQAEEFRQILTRAAGGKHLQQKLGGRYIPLEMQLGPQRVPVLVEEQAARYVIVYDRPGKTWAPGHDYHIRSAQDQQRLLLLCRRSGIR